jgi:hypothetical protein
MQGSEVWNPRSGASLTGVRFEDIKIARHVAGSKDVTDYEDAPKYAFGPEEPTLGLGLMYGGDCGKAGWGEENGKKFVTADIDYSRPPDYVYEGEATVAPYTVYNAGGVTAGEFDSMFAALHHAGVIGSASNAAYVLDGNGLEIFRRQARNRYFMYDGMCFAGSLPSDDAIAWADTRSRSYLIDGQGSAFQFLGAEHMPGRKIAEGERGLELHAGAYNYMFSKEGEVTPSGTSPGYGYLSAYLRLSEMRYRPFPDNQYGVEEWNAYVLFNGQAAHKGGGQSEVKDFGFIGNEYDKVNKKARWRFCGDALAANPDYVASEMYYDPETGDYIGGDDLFCELMAVETGWIFSVTNLRTGVNKTVLQKYTDNNTLGSTEYLRMMLGASYCPTIENLWDARRGDIYIRNVVFDGVKVARYDASHVATEDYRNDAEALEDFYPGEAAVAYGFAQGADCASFRYGTRNRDGVYASGNEYKKGDKYLIYNTFYDGGR